MVRALQAALIGMLVVGGALLWRDAPRPIPPGLQTVARGELEAIFGQDVQYASMYIDIGKGVVIDNLRIPSRTGYSVSNPLRPGAPPRRLDGFSALQVEIEHDPAALAVGLYEIRTLRVHGATVFLVETEAGIEQDFRLDLPEGSGSGESPTVEIVDATIYVRARAGSERFSAGSMLVTHIDRLDLDPDTKGRLVVSGELAMRELGQDDEPILLEGHVDPRDDTFSLRIACEHLSLTPELLDLLHPDVAAPLRQESIKGGAIVVSLERARGETARLSVAWDADVNVQVEDIPGIEMIEATTKQQLQELFGGGVLRLTVDDDRINIQNLVTEMAGGRVSAAGWIKRDTGAFELEFRIEDLDLEDPAIARALGEEGAEIFAQFAPSGIVDALGRVRRTTSGKTTWQVDVLLENAAFEFIGALTPDGHREGFPYRIEEATGRVRIRPEGVFFDDIVGFHRAAEVTVRGHGRKSWTGGETGRILFPEAGTDIRLTIEVVNMRIDEDVKLAIEGSEFAGLLDEFQLAGVIDRVEIDVVSIPGLDRAAQTEVRLSLEGEQFRYAPFPMPVEDVRGEITMRRPVLDEKRRGRIYAFAVDGWSDGAPIHVEASIVDHENRGRLIVTAEDIPIAGHITQTVLESEITGEDLGPVWAWLDPRGRADVHADLPMQDDPDPMRVTIDLKGASIRLAASETDTPLPIRALRGRIQVIGKSIQLLGLEGRLAQADVRLEGALPDGPDGSWAIHLEGGPMRITEETLLGLRALTDSEELLPGGLRVEPGGTLDLDLDLTRDVGTEPLRADWTATNVDLFVLVPQTGRVHVKGEQIVVGPHSASLTQVDASRPGLRVRMPRATLPLGDGEDSPPLDGEFELALRDFEITPAVEDLLPDAVRALLVEWASGRQLTTESLRISASTGQPIRIEGPLDLIVPEGEPIDGGPRGRIVFAPLVIASDEGGAVLGGSIQLEGFSIDDLGPELGDLSGTIVIDRLRVGEDPKGSGRLVDLAGKVEGVSVEGLGAPLQWNGGVFQADPITGRVSGGTLRAHIRVHTGEPGAYEGRADIAEFDVARLQQDLAPTGAPYAGKGWAQVQFQNRSGNLEDLTGSGFVRIRQGALGELPVVANIFTLFGELFGKEEKPKFTTVDAEFVLQREVFRFSRLDLAGPLFEMPGRGTIDLTKQVDLRFTPDFIKSMALPGLMQLPLIGDILGGALREELLYAVRARGDIGNAKVEIEAFPPLGLDRGPGFEGMGPQDLPRRKLPGWFR
jgi:hypothetical protein